MSDPYAELGLPSNATKDEVKKRYRELVMLYHPDRTGNAASGKQFAAIDEAYHRIMDEPAPRRTFMGREVKREGGTFMLFREYLSLLMKRASVAIIVANFVMMVIDLVYIMATGGAQGMDLLFDIIWWAMLPSNVIGKLLPYTLAFDWTVLLWFSYLYWYVKYRQGTTSKRYEPDWSAFDGDFLRRP